MPREQDEQQSYDSEFQDDMKNVLAELEGRESPPADDKAPTDAPTDPVGEGEDGEPEAKARDDGRDDKGRFTAKKDKNDQPDPAADDPAKVLDPATAKPAGEQKPLNTAVPPSSWAPVAKAEWEKLPQHVREAIALREDQVAQGFQMYRGLKRYADMAQASGTTLETALERYTQIENTMRSDPIAGVFAVLHNIGLTKQQAMNLMLTGAERLGYRIPAARQNGAQDDDGEDQNDPIEAALAPIIEKRFGPMQQRLQSYDRYFANMQQANQTAREQSYDAAVGEMIADPKYRYFEQLEDEMVRLIQTGYVKRTGDMRRDLQTAYDTAARLHPEVSKLQSEAARQAETEQRQAKEKQADDRSRKASRSLTGSSTEGDGPPARGKQRPGMSYDQDLMADVMAAFDGK